MEFNFSGKVCLVTGAGAGMGKATAIQYARNGAKVGINDLTAEICADTLEAIRAVGGQCFGVYGDISDPAVSEALTDQAMERYGRIDALANVAGVVIPGSIISTTQADIDKTLRINVKGSILTTQAAVRYMRAQEEGGAVVMVGSSAGLLGVSDRVAYSASKGAIIAVTRAIAVDLLHTKVRVNCICPGPVNSPSMEARFQAAPGLREKFLAGALNDRLGEAEELAQAILFASCGEMGYLNGAIISVDGGLTCSQGIKK